MNQFEGKEVNGENFESSGLSRLTNLEDMHTPVLIDEHNCDLYDKVRPI